MSFFNKMQSTMDKIVGPIAQKMNESKSIKALTAGMMGTMPIALGVAAISIIGNLPLPGLITFFEKIGLTLALNELLLVTISATAIYLVITVPYNYVKNEGENGLSAGIISLGAFLIMMPSIINIQGDVLAAIETKYIGSDGIFLGMVLSILVAKAYIWLCNKNLKIKLPESVPPMVTDSLSPIFISMIIFTILFLIKVFIASTSYGNIFYLFNTIVTTPLLSLGATPMSLIIVFTFASFMWFFGVHPSPIISTYAVIMTSVFITNVEAYAMGQPLPYLTFTIVFSCVYFSGTGNTLGLSLLLYTAKSQRYKAMKHLCFMPNFFNINEPMIFGIPIMLNTIFFIPMILNTLIPGLLGLLIASFYTFNPNVTIVLPWVTPSIITNLIVGGVPLFLLIVLCIIVTTVIWFPFFKIADKKACEEETNCTV